jgi:hypothetical protein
MIVIIELLNDTANGSSADVTHDHVLQELRCRKLVQPDKLLKDKEFTGFTLTAS